MTPRFLSVALCSIAFLLTACVTPTPTQKEQADTLVHGDYVVTMAANKVIRDGAVAIRDGVIIEVGSRAALETRFDATQVIGGRDRIVVPGLVNGHTHAAMTLLRGIADDLPLMTWLENYIFPAERQFVDERFVRVGTELACWEMIRGGTTAFVDMYYFPDAVAETVEQCGLRAIVVPSVIDQQAPDAANAEASLAQAVDFVQRWQGRSDRITPAIGGHAIYTLPENRLRAIASAAEALQAPVGIHLAETLAEHAFAESSYGKSPIQFLESINFFRNPVIGAHVVHPDDNDIRTLANQQVGAIHNPTSNMKLASGRAPVTAMLAAGVRVGLGTDGTASNNDLDMWEEIRLASLLAKIGENNPEALPAETVLALATSAGADAIGLGAAIGKLATGMQADLLQLDISRLSAKPLYDPLSHLVYVADQQDVVLTMVAGQVLMRDRQVMTIDEDRLRRNVAEISAAIREAVRPE